MRDGGGGKKMERGKAHTVVGAAHHEDHDHLTWQRVPPATQLTTEENSVRGRRIGHQRQGIERGGGGIARGREELRAGGRKRARGRLEAHGGKIAASACVPPAFWCLF